MHKIKVEEFEGPLDLLLQLIEDQKLEITKVSLASVTEQYIQTLNQSAKDQIKTTELADFLVIAARLLLIKSRALLPFLEWGDDEDEGEDLTKQVKIDKEYLAAMKQVQGIISKKRFAFSRAKLLVDKEVEFAPPPKLKKDKLREVFSGIIHGLDPFLNLQTDVIRRTIHIQEKISQIRQRIFKQATTRFSDILKEAKDKTEVIVSFLAVLELMKQKTIIVKQDNNFEDITIERFK